MISNELFKVIIRAFSQSCRLETSDSRPYAVHLLFSNPNEAPLVEHVQGLDEENHPFED